MEKAIFDKGNLQVLSLEKAPLPNLSDGEVLLRIKKLGFTSNNITYGLLGNRFRYWEFFPDPKGGVLPAWGYAEIEESRLEDLPIGSEYYGFFPLATHLIVRPARYNRFGFHDGTSHRVELPHVYNYYEKARSLTGRLRSLYMIFQPLFATSFLLEDALREEVYHNSQQIVILSASGKTAVSLARQLKVQQCPLPLIALTSHANVGFCSSLGCYDDVFSYDLLEGIPNCSSTVIDFTGNASLLARVQQRLENTVNACIAVGLSHGENMAMEKRLTIPPVLFFAPAQAKKRQEQWGGKVFSEKLGADLLPFIEWIDPHLKPRSISFKNKFQNFYKDCLEKGFKPDEICLIDLK